MGQAIGEIDELMSSKPMNRDHQQGEGAEPAATLAGLDLTSLTPTERRVATLALTGRSVRVIADELVVSESTVHTHLTHIYRKLGIRNRLDLLALAVRPETGRDAPVAPARASSRGQSLLGITLGMVLSIVLALLAVLVPPSALVIGPGLLVGGALAGRRSSTLARGASIPLLIGGLLGTLIAAGGLLVVRTG